ncbi:MAG: TIR domain-containing protein [Anaerolineae bacterium]|nr:TIR domain-containing protein [Anaerolineae bacterium]
MSAYPRLLFLSYAHADSLAVRRSFVKLLRGAGYAVWIDRTGLRVGHDWAVEIRSAIASSDAFLVFLSPNSVREESYVNQEIKWALQNRKVIFPLLIAPFPNSDLPENLEGLQWVDFTDPDDAIWEQRSTDLLDHLSRLDERQSPLPADLNILLPDAPPSSPPIFDAPLALPIPAPPSDDWVEIKPGSGSARGASRSENYSVSRLIGIRDISVFRKSDDYDARLWWTTMGWDWIAKSRGTIASGDAGGVVNSAHVSWYEAVAFARWLSFHHFGSPDLIRLLSVHEWMRCIHQVKEKGFLSYGDEWCLTAYAGEYDAALEALEQRDSASTNYLFDVLRTVCSWSGTPADISRRAMKPEFPGAGFRLACFPDLSSNR